MYVGVDYHKKFSVATRMDEQGVILEQIKLTNRPDTLRGYFGNLPRGTKVAVEATQGWYAFYELIEDLCPDVTLAHPVKTRAIAEARIKTDKIDATMLAHLLRTNLLPSSCIPSREIRDLKEILRYRASLVSLQTSLKNKIHAVLAKNGMAVPYTDIFGKKAIQWIKGLSVRPCYVHEAAGYLILAETVMALIATITATIEREAKLNDDALLLLSIPGIGPYSALLIVTEIGDITRFPSAKKLCSYAGLVPSVRSSGGKTRYGSITKQGSKWLRWILIELSHHFAGSSPQMKALYERILAKHGKNTARVAVARQMLVIIYSMLTQKRSFRREEGRSSPWGHGMPFKQHGGTNP